MAPRASVTLGVGKRGTLRQTCADARACSAARVLAGLGSPALGVGSTGKADEIDPRPAACGERL